MFNPNMAVSANPEIEILLQQIAYLQSQLQLAQVQNGQNSEQFQAPQRQLQHKARVREIERQQSF